MKDYFFLQYIMTNRTLKEAGINPLFGYILGLLAIVIVSEIIFLKTAFAKYLLILICIAILVKLSEKNRSDFLLTAFGDTVKRKIRVIENLIISIPFIAILIVKNAIFESLILLFISSLIAIVPFQVNLNFSIPTPFSKNPFEFPVGFRKSFYLFPIAYALSIIAISVDNLNLGIFSMLLIFLISMSYYLKPENEYYVWIHASTAKRFLINKIKLASKNVLLLSLPVLLCLLIYYPGMFIQILIFFIIGICFLWTVILAKYSAYPREMNVSEAILLALSIYFPPLLLAILPFFYTKSISKLKVFLNDQD